MINYENTTREQIIECCEKLTKRLIHSESFIKNFAIPCSMHGITVIDCDGSYRNPHDVFDKLVDRIQKRTEKSEQQHVALLEDVQNIVKDLKKLQTIFVEDKYFGRPIPDMISPAIKLIESRLALPDEVLSALGYFLNELDICKAHVKYFNKNNLNEVSKDYAKAISMLNIAIIALQAYQVSLENKKAIFHADRGDYHVWEEPDDANFIDSIADTSYIMIRADQLKPMYKATLKEPDVKWGLILW